MTNKIEQNFINLTPEHIIPTIKTGLSNVGFLFVAGTSSFIKITPEEAINLDFKKSIKYLEKLIGAQKLKEAFNCEENYPSPVSNCQNSEWLKKVKIIEINPRMCNTFWGIIKYAMTFPEDAIHLLPLWEAGCDGSMYAPVNWQLNKELIDEDLQKLGFDTAEKQLKLVVNILHAMNKTIAFDVLPHADRFSEIVFVQPHFFEWIKLNKEKTHQLKYPVICLNSLHLDVQKIIINYLKLKGDSFGNSVRGEVLNNFFGEDISEEQRMGILFGNPENKNQRRIELIDYVRNEGYETIPVSENMPSRPIIFDKIENNENTNWATFKVSGYCSKNNRHIESRENLFGSITPYKWYQVDDEGYPIPEKPIKEVWDYFLNKIVEFQQEYNFDFIRADMAHIQLAHCHQNPEKNLINKKEIWAKIKDEIQAKVPYFGTFAESFLSDYYISAFQDMENKKFDIVLGFLNYVYINREYFNYIEDYMALDRPFKTCIATMAHDSDLPKHDPVYKSPKANEVRLFTALFLNLPSYTGMGIETRDFQPSGDEHYAANFIKYQPQKYKWGRNFTFFESLTKMRELYSEIKHVINEQEHCWIETENPNHIAWLFYDKNTKNPSYLFFLNIDIDFSKDEVTIKKLANNKIKFASKEYFMEKVLSNSDNPDLVKNKLKIALKDELKIPNITIGDFCVYKINPIAKSKNILNIFSSSNKKKNNQILLMSLECAPYVKSGGLADANCDFTRAFKESHHEYDVRIIIPLFNASSRKTINVKDFDVEYTGICCNYNYGVSISSAYLYKIKNPYNRIPIYLVYSDAFSYKKSPYDGSGYDLLRLSSAFSKACVNLLKNPILSFKEKLNPKILHITDWHISIDKNKEPFFKNSSLIHVLHNIGYTYQGKVDPLFTLLNKFDLSEIDLFLKNNDIKQELKELLEQNKNIFKNGIEILQTIEKNYENLTIPSNQEILNNISNRIINLFQEKDWDEEFYYNPLRKSIEESDFWITDSDTYFKEITSSEKFSTSLFDTLNNNKEKGAGILAGIDPERFNPVDNKFVKFNFSVNNYNEEKSKNKEYLQKAFSSSNPTYDVSLFNENEQFKLKGSLSVEPDVPLLLLSSRLDPFQKGIDIFLNIIPDILKNDKKCQIILAGPNFLDDKNSIVYQFSEKIFKIKDYCNRLLIIDDFIPIERYLAGADIFIMPSRYEPCGFSQLIAMRMGTVPVVSDTGGLRDTVISLLEDDSLATGFKTKTSLMESLEPEKELLNAVNSALECYYNDKNTWNKLVKNSMEYDCSWNTDKIEKFVHIYKKLGLI